MSDDIWRIRLIGQDKRLSISKCWVRTPHPSPGIRRLMEGRQIVTLKIGVRFPSITLIWASMHSGDCSGL